MRAEVHFSLFVIAKGSAEVITITNFPGSSGNHTPSIKPILPEQVTLSSGNEISFIDDSTRLGMSCTIGLVMSR